MEGEAAGGGERGTEARRAADCRRQRGRVRASAMQHAARMTAVLSGTARNRPQRRGAAAGVSGRSEQGENRSGGRDATPSRPAKDLACLQSNSEATNNVRGLKRAYSGRQELVLLVFAMPTRRQLYSRRSSSTNLPPSADRPISASEKWLFHHNDNTCNHNNHRFLLPKTCSLEYAGFCRAH